VNSVRNDTETMACAVCGTAFRRSGRRLHCSGPAVRPPGAAAARRRESRLSPSPTPSTSARCVTPGSSASSTARSATRSPAGSVPAATVLAVTSRSRSPSSSSRNSLRHVSVKRRHEGGDQRAGIEGRSPRSHPQVLTISLVVAGFAGYASGEHHSSSRSARVSLTRVRPRSK